MNEPVAYLNGQFLPISQAALSVFDLGIVAGASVSEMIRTFRHQPFRLDQHLDRLSHSLDALRIKPEHDQAGLKAICHNVVEQNVTLLPAEHDLGLIIFVTTGQNLTYLGAAGRELAKRPSLCVHTFPLPFELWADKYDTGLHLVTTNIKCLPDDCIDPGIKHRNRLHWHLADLEAKQIDTAAMALLTDHEDYLTETATGNLCVVDGATILTPEQHVLKGVTRDVVAELASTLGFTFAYTRLSRDDLALAKEAFITSTPHCLLPVTSFDQQPIGSGKPGPVFRRLIEAFGELVGVNVVEQMRTGAKARSNMRPIS